MPELPEVETIKRDLENKIVGSVITDVYFLWPGTLKGTSQEIFNTKVSGKKITQIRRRAKSLIIDLEDDLSLLLHMKMTGHLLVEPSGKKVSKEGEWCEKDDYLSDPYNQYIRAIFYLDNGKELAFSDLRKFGYVKLMGQNQLKDFLSSYGPEPFSKDFNAEYLKEIFAKKNIAIKKVIMDQHIIAGIGNIYADEILWEIKVHPETKTSKLKSKQIEEFIEATKEILKRSIEQRGTSSSDFRDTDGARGNFGNLLNVYKREGQPCPRDGAIIEKIKVGGRGTHFCPKEQRLDT